MKDYLTKKFAGSWIRKKFIPDPGVKKHKIPDPDPQHWV
jgi:hypothetical protein